MGEWRQLPRVRGNSTVVTPGEDVVELVLDKTVFHLGPVGKIEDLCELRCEPEFFF
jgi:hypothetical protein